MLAMGRNYALGLLAVCALLGVLFYVFPRPEPHYQGRSLSAWLPLLHSAQRRSATQAIEAIGRGALPALVSRAQEKENPLLAAYVRFFWRKGIPAWAKRWLPDPGRWDGRYWEGRMLALDAIERLGTNAVAALPTLLRSPDFISWQVSCPVLAREPAPVCRALWPSRMLAACGVIAREG